MQDSQAYIQGQERAALLIAQYLRGEISPAEKEELDAWISKNDWHKTYFERVASAGYIDQLMVDYHQAAGLRTDLLNRVELKIAERKGEEIYSIPPAHRIYFFRTAWFRYAAAILIIICGVGAYFLINNKKTDQGFAGNIKQLQTDVAPGGEKAVLTLADGSKIVLDNAANGNLAQQGNAQVVKLANGQIAYNVKGLSNEVLLNTVSTPVGGQYHVTLPDGTEVWLNAASSITYPVSFHAKDAKERKVTITGEVYFEVAKNASMPFRVGANNMIVEVLGTHFNINSYADEDYIKTTLLEGAVELKIKNEKLKMKPGQQVSISHSPLTVDHSLFIISNPDLDEVMAWKNGLFHFNSSSLQEVMKQIVRWYDVDVVYQGKIPERKFDGEISRQSNLLQVLKILEETKVHFTIEDRKLIVKP